jgi:hypothetical protein
VSGTLKGGFDVLSSSGGFDISYWDLGPFGHSSISDTLGNSIGDIDLGGFFTLPAGAAKLGFDAAKTTEKSSGICRAKA